MSAAGKIGGSDVADVANFTVEQDVIRDLTGTRRSYAAVLTADKNRNLRDGGRDKL